MSVPFLQRKADPNSVLAVTPKLEIVLIWH